MLGSKGLRRGSDFALLNANYLMVALQGVGFEIAFPQRRTRHALMVTTTTLKVETGVCAEDIANRLRDKGLYFSWVEYSQSLPECLRVEPRGTESKQTLDIFVSAMKEILQECYAQPDRVSRNCPRE